MKAYGKAVKIMQGVEGSTEDHHLVMRITGYGIRIRSARHQAKLNSLAGMVILFLDFENALDLDDRALLL